MQVVSVPEEGGVTPLSHESAPVDYTKCSMSILNIGCSLCGKPSGVAFSGRTQMRCFYGFYLHIFYLTYFLASLGGLMENLHLQCGL